MTEAQAEVRRLTAQFRVTFSYPMSHGWNADTTVIPLQRDIVGDFRGELLLLLAPVGITLIE